MVGAAEDFAGGAHDFDGAYEGLAVRALKNLALRALQRSLAVRALKEKHLTYAQASYALPSLAD